MNQSTHTPDDTNLSYEKPTLIEIGELKEIVRGSGSAMFDGLTDSPSCSTSNGLLTAPDDNC